jgi:hypothetical protein
VLYVGSQHLWRSSNEGQSWTRISPDEGAHWRSLRQGLPDTQVADLVVKDNDLVIATHGRSFYVLDDISPLRDFRVPDPAGAPHLYGPADAVRTGRGVTVYYALPRPAQRVTLEFLDARGAVIRSFSGTPADSARGQAGGAGGGEDEDDEESPARPREPTTPVKAGLNRFVWDLRLPGAEDFPGLVLWAARLVGPRVLPGAYQVRLLVDGRAVATQPFRVTPDPRYRTVPSAAIDAQHALAVRVRQRTTDANRGVLLVRGIRRQLDDRLAHTQDGALRTALEAARTKLSAIEDSLYNPRLRSSQDPLNFPIRLNNKMAALLGVIESTEAAPTEQTYAVFADLSRRIDVQLNALAALVRDELPALNARLRAAALPEVRAEPERPSATERRPPAGEDDAEEAEDEEEARDW